MIFLMGQFPDYGLPPCKTEVRYPFMAGPSLFGYYPSSREKCIVWRLSVVVGSARVPKVVVEIIGQLAVCEAIIVGGGRGW